MQNTQSASEVAFQRVSRWQNQEIICFCAFLSDWKMKSLCPQGKSRTSPSWRLHCNCLQEKRQPTIGVFQPSHMTELTRSYHTGLCCTYVRTGSGTFPACTTRWLWWARRHQCEKVKVIFQYNHEILLRVCFLLSLRQWNGYTHTYACDSFLVTQDTTHKSTRTNLSVTLKRGESYNLTSQRWQWLTQKPQSAEVTGSRRQRSVTSRRPNGQKLLLKPM